MATASNRWTNEQSSFELVVPGVLDADSSAGPANLDAEIRTQVWLLLGALYPQARPINRRRFQRYPYPHLIHLTPVGESGESLDERPLVVAGKNISEHGISFFHSGPLALRRAIASLETGSGNWFHFLVDLTWCRFTHHGWYESGGFFLRPVSAPPAMIRG
ncbi:MAG: hypothetical protein K1X71_00645 [Pirellulales bacterium]|nr:hypothetical protein [Pirellulales bacterium]